MANYEQYEKEFRNGMTRTKYRKNWCNEWKAWFEKEEKKQLVIFAQYGKDSIRENLIKEPETLKTPTELYNAAVNNFRIAGYNKPCTRCNGSGRYSYNMRSGSTCFKCQGKKLQAVIPSKRELEKLIKEYPAGIVDSNPNFTGGSGQVLKTIKE